MGNRRKIGLLLSIMCLVLSESISAEAQNTNRGQDDWTNFGLYYNKSIHKEIEKRVEEYNGPFDYKTFLETVMPSDFKLSHLSIDYLGKSYWVAPYCWGEMPIYLEISKNCFKVYLYSKSKDELSLRYESEINPYFTNDFVPDFSSNDQQATSRATEGYFLQPGNWFFSCKSGNSICISSNLGTTAKYTRVKELPSKNITKILGEWSLDRAFNNEATSKGNYYYDRYLFRHIEKYAKERRAHEANQRKGKMIVD